MTLAGDAVIRRVLRPSGAGRWAETAALAALMLGGAYAVSWFAARYGLPVSRGLVFEGRWILDRWTDFPWPDCIGMLAFMIALPVAWESAKAVRPRDIGARADLRALWWTAAAVAGPVILLATREQGPQSASRTMLAAYFAVSAAAEEVAFRGFLQRRLTRSVGVVVSMAAVTLVFVAWHGLPGSWETAAVRAISSLALGLVYDRSRSLLPPVAGHFLFNMAVAA